MDRKSTWEKIMNGNQEAGRITQGSRNHGDTSPQAVWKCAGIKKRQKCIANDDALGHVHDN